MIHGHFRARDLVQSSDLQIRGRCSPESAETGSQLPRDQEEREEANLESSLYVLEKAWFNAQVNESLDSKGLEPFITPSVNTQGRRIRIII
ncbi:hypothetical protein TNCT_239341 [Trichonephila clavata]|uniref:Uncharacterized protein n=1 Tax=Trichonephila clavata TaxID=2740835 RepID=A0A8X6HJB5_TRICU|nr:hypothetical protein TNCT_239341 [Trichonephila clavata]